MEQKLSKGSEMAEYDLTSKIGSHLDRHLVFPMLEFLSVKSVSKPARYREREIVFHLMPTLGWHGIC